MSWCSPRFAVAGVVSPRHAGSLLRTLFERSGHCTAPELAEQVGTQVRAQGLEIHMSTIYRFLDELEELGVVTHSHLGHGRAVYDFRPSATPIWCASGAEL